MIPASVPQFSLEGRRALVTGASRGIGRALAVGLASFGCDVALAGRDADALDATAGQVEAHGRRAVRITMDVTDIASIQAGTDAAAAGLSGLDILVANAGVEQVRASLDVDEALWDRIVDTNLKGAFFACQAAARHMATSGRGGSIVTLASLTSEAGVPTAVPYGSSKAGVLGMTRALAAEWASRGIRVNALAPGYFRTELTETFYADPAWSERMLAKIPAARFGAMDDLVGATVFLTGDAARYVTGQILYVDGGITAAL